MAVSDRGEVTAYPPAEVMTSPANNPAWAAGVPQTTPLTSAPVPAGGVAGRGRGSVVAGAAAAAAAHGVGLMRVAAALPLRAGAAAVREEHAEEGRQADLDPGALAAGRDLPGDGHGLVDGDGVAGV